MEDQTVVPEVTAEVVAPVEEVVSPFDDITTVEPTKEVGPVELDITNPEHGNLTYEELQAGKLNKKGTK